MGDKEGKPEPGDKGRRSGPDNLQREKSNHLSVKGDFAAAALAISATFINRPFGTAASPATYGDARLSLTVTGLTRGWGAVHAKHTECQDQLYNMIILTGNSKKSWLPHSPFPFRFEMNSFPQRETGKKQRKEKKKKKRIKTACML